MFGRRKTRERGRDVRYRIYRVSPRHEARGWLGTVDEETLSAYSCPEEYLSLNFGGGDYRLYEVIDGRMTNRVYRYVVAGYPIVRRREFDFPVWRPAVPTPEEIELERLRRKVEELKREKEKLEREKERELMKKDFDLQLEKVRREIEVEKLREERRKEEKKEPEPSSSSSSSYDWLHGIIELNRAAVEAQSRMLMRNFDMMLALFGRVIEQRREERLIKALQSAAEAISDSMRRNRAAGEIDEER